MRPRVYLAGPIAGHDYDGADSWRSYAKRILDLSGIDAFSPLRGKEYLRRHGTLHSGSYTENPLSTAKGLTTRDRYDCCTADLIIANLAHADRVSIGTMIELGWADAFRVPIVVLMEEPPETMAGEPVATRLGVSIRNLHDHAMVRELAGFIVSELDEALAIACHILLP